MEHHDPALQEVMQSIDRIQRLLEKLEQQTEVNTEAFFDAGEAMIAEVFERFRQHLVALQRPAPANFLH